MMRAAQAFRAAALLRAPGLCAWGTGYGASLRPPQAGADCAAASLGGTPLGGPARASCVGGVRGSALCSLSRWKVERGGAGKRPRCLGGRRVGLGIGATVALLDVWRIRCPEPWAGCAGDREVRLRHIEPRRLHHFSPAPELFEAESGHQIFGRYLSPNVGAVLPIPPFADLVRAPDGEPAHSMRPASPANGAGAVCSWTRQQHIADRLAPAPPGASQSRGRARHGPLRFGRRPLVWTSARGRAGGVLTRLANQAGGVRIFCERPLLSARRSSFQWPGLPPKRFTASAISEELPHRCPVSYQLRPTLPTFGQHLAMFGKT